MVVRMGPAVREVIDRVNDRCDVLLLGERGSGKSTILHAVHARVSGGGTVGVLFTAGGTAELATITRHPSAAGQVFDHRSAVQWLTGELSGSGGGVVVVDDIDRVDRESLDVVEEVLRVRPRTQLVATAATDPARGRSEALARIVVERMPLVVRVPPLDLASVSALMAQVLGGPAEARLVASVLAQTGGNPRAVTAMLRAARAAGTIVECGGMWAGEPGEERLDAIGLTFLPTLDERERAAVEILACAGPLQADALTGLVPSEVLSSLIAAGRVVGHDVPGFGPVLAVAPPALAAAVRRATEPFRFQQMLREVRGHLGPGDALRSAPESPRLPGEPGALQARVPLAAVTHERADARADRRRRSWTAERSVVAANGYLHLLLQDPGRDDVDEVIAGTLFGEGEDADDLARFAYYEARWAEWTGAAPRTVRAQVVARAPEHPDVIVDLAAVRDEARQQLVRDAGTPSPLPGAASTSGLVRSLVAEAEAAALLEAGHAVQAQLAIDSHLPSDDDEIDRPRLTSLAIESLMVLGELDEAENRARAELRQAYDRADLLGVHVYACTLAEVLFFAGRPAQAWEALSASLQLGATGPLYVPCYRRGLAVGVILQANAGNAVLARVLLQELDRVANPSGDPSPSLDVLVLIAAATTDPGATATGDDLWETGARYAAHGQVLPAMLAWLGMTRELTPAEVRVVLDTCDDVSLPLFEPYMRLQVALAEDGPLDPLVVERVHPSVAPFLAEAAARRLRARGSQPVLDDATLASRQSLTERETEIATLAADGLTNAGIATLLSLSIRTVENHMGRVLRKTGCRSRRDLTGVFAVGESGMETAVVRAALGG